MMRLVGLSVGYPPAAPLLSGLDGALRPGTFTALLGRNGCGKSTLLRTLAGLQPPLAGRVEGEKPAIVLTAMPQLPRTTVVQLVAYGRLPYTGLLGRLRPADHDAAMQAIRLVGIEALATRRFNALSDGERQKVMIARALAQGGATLLLDEPAAFLDYPSRRQLMALLQRLAHQDGKAILLSTHDVELALSHADRVWRIADGQLQDLAPDTLSPEDVF